MRAPSVAMIAAASAVIVFAGCSNNGSSSISPFPGSVNQARTTHAIAVHSTSVLPPALQARFPAPRPSDPRMSHDSCPATGKLIYAADYALGVVNIYDGSLNFCGQLTGFSGPQGMSVHNGDLLVANTNTSQVLRFHRGATSPFRTYQDTNEYPVDAIVMGDGTVVVSNIIDTSGGPGSISTFAGGGRFIGTFFPPNMAESFFITSFRTTIWGDGFDSGFIPAMWSMTCPHGACASMTDLGEVMQFPGGMATSRSGDAIASDQIANTADTFELPNLTAATFNWNSGGDTDGIGTDHDLTISHVYGADALDNLINCYNYKQGGHSPGSCGSVGGNSGGEVVGVAVDPGS